MKHASLIALVVANLLVALQALRHEWGYYETLLVYWIEALVIGGYNVLRLLIVGLASEQPLGSWASTWVTFTPGFRVFATLLGTGFFAFKYTMFAIIVGVFVVALPALSASDGAGGARVALGLRAAGPGVAVAVGGLVLSHGVSFVRNFLLRREYARMSVIGLVLLPYARMVLVAIVLALGLVLASVLRGLSTATAFAVVMVFVKLAADIVSHTVEHSWIERRPLRMPFEVRVPSPPSVS